MGAIRAGQGKLPACAVDQDRSSGHGTFPPCPAPRQPASRACAGGKGPVNRVLQGSRLLLGTTDAQQFPAYTQHLAGSGALESGGSIPDRFISQQLWADRRRVTTGLAGWSPQRAGSGACSLPCPLCLLPSVPSGFIVFPGRSTAQQGCCSLAALPPREALLPPDRKY